MSEAVFTKNLLSGLTPAQPLTQSASYAISLSGLDAISFQAIWSDSSPAAAVMASASKVTHAVQATQTVTVVDYTLLAGKKITINGVDFVEGADWTAATSNASTATSIAALVPTGITGNAVSAVATFTKTAYGTAGNAVTITTDAAAGGLTLGGATFAGGVDAIFTKTAHGLTTGLVGRMTTSTTLPTGLSAGVDYFVIKVSADTFSLASSLVNANAGTPVEFTTNGTGNQTFTPTAISWVVKLQGGNDGTHWTDLAGLTATISAAGSALWQINQPPYAWVNIVATATAGVLNLSVVGNGLRYYRSK